MSGWFGYEKGMNKKEFLKEKLLQLMFAWECHPFWYKIAHIIELFIMDAFVDLFITLCIVVNTIFMALDHAEMNDTLSETLKYGNYVSPQCRSCLDNNRLHSPVMIAQCRVRNLNYTLLELKVKLDKIIYNFIHRKR